MTGAVASVPFNFKDKDGNPVAGQTTPLEVGGNLAIAAPAGVHTIASPVATALTYAAGKCIGAPVALAGFVRAAGLSSMIQSAVMRSVVAQANEIDLVIFRGQPTVLSGLADNVTFAVATADISLVSKVLKFAAWDSLGSGAISNLDAVGKYLGLAAGTSAFVQFVARGAVTLNAATDLSVSLGLYQD